MLRKFSNSRTAADNVKLGVLTAFSAGMVNIASLLIFLAFTSNVTGNYAILAAEISKGNWYQVAIVAAWISTFFTGSFLSNILVIHVSKVNTYLAHALPIILEILCLLSVGVYGELFYQETLAETEVLLGLMLFAMGLQNGLTASISNFAVKTTHLTGITTDLGILFSMFTVKMYRNNKILSEKATLLLSITAAYLAGAIISGFAYQYIGFKLFYLVSLSLLVVISYDQYKIRKVKNWKRQRRRLPVHQQKSIRGLKLVSSEKQESQAQAAAG